MNQLPTRRFFVVIHTITKGLLLTLGQASIAMDSGADGIFLIPDYAKGSLRATTDDQFRYLEKIKEVYPELPVGVNFLTSPVNLIPRLYSTPLDMFQTDSSSVEGIERLKLPNAELFLGVAFKYSKDVGLTGATLKEHCEKVASIADIPTTSGNATGVEADIAKIREIRSYLPDGKRFGIASGITEHNVMSYLKEGVTDFLVATSLIEEVDEIYGADLLSYQKVARMAEIIHGYRD